MKSHSVFAAFALLLLSVFCATTAKADSLTLSLNNATQSGALGSTLSFTGTVKAAAANTGTTYFNSDTFSFASPYKFDDNAFLNGLFNISLDPGQSYTGVLFSVMLPSSAGIGTYLGSFSIYGGADYDTNNLLGTAKFSVTGTSAAAAVTPEPSALLLLVTGTASTLAFARRRMVQGIAC